MFKFKIFLFSSAAFFLGVSLCGTSIKAMDDDDLRSSLFGRSFNDFDLFPVDDSNQAPLPPASPSPAPLVEQTDSITSKYPLNLEGNKALKKAAKMGDDEARDEMINRYNSSILVDPDLKDFLKWPQLENKIFTKSGYLQILLRVFINESKTQFPDLIRRMEEEGEKENVVAQFNMGWMNCLGIGLDQNYEKADEWLSRAARNNHALSYTFLGNLYHPGNGFANDTRFIGLYEQGAELGCPMSLAGLGELYREGYPPFVRKNLSKAIELNLMAATQGFLQSQYELFELNNNNKGEALKWGMIYLSNPATVWDRADQENISKYLSFFWDVPLVGEEQTFSLSNLQSIMGHLHETKENHFVQAQSHNPNGSYLENSVPMPGFYQGYKQLFEIGEKFYKDLDHLKDIEPGFMINVALPTREIGESINTMTTPQFFSLDRHKNRPYLTIGEKNCEIVKKFLDSQKGVDEELEKATAILNDIKSLYEANLKDLRDLNAELLNLRYAVLAAGEKADKTNDLEAKRLAKQNKSKLQKQFEEKSEEFKKKNESKIKQDYERLKNEEENLRNAGLFIQNFIEGGLGQRNEEFLKEYPFKKFYVPEV